MAPQLVQDHVACLMAMCYFREPDGPLSSPRFFFTRPCDKLAGRLPGGPEKGQGEGQEALGRFEWPGACPDYLRVPGLPGLSPGPPPDSLVTSSASLSEGLFEIAMLCLELLIQVLQRKYFSGCRMSSELDLPCCVRSGSIA